MKHTTRNMQYEKVLIILITFLAFGIRIWNLGDVPPGWRDDELIESLIISQYVRDGELAFYFPDASGHEALYHTLKAFFMGVFGGNWLGIRLLSVVFGLLAVPVTWLLGRKLFGPWVGLLAAAGLTFSFWSLMYSRFGLRHISLPLLTLLTFYFFWRGLGAGGWGSGSREQGLSLPAPRSPLPYFVAAAVFMGLGFYTYFASRGVPVILLAFVAYVAVVDWALFKRRWKGIVLMFVLTAVLAAPLFITLQNQPESEARVAEVAVPLVEAQAGNFAPLIEHIVVTLSMFHADGDGEWLYNIPGRPVFGWIGALFFWIGILIATYYALAGLFRVAWRFYNSRIPVLRGDRWSHVEGTQHATRNTQHATRSTHISLASAFLIAWWFAAISPGFMSVPPASLGHTILAQSVVYIIAALPIWWLGSRGWGLGRQRDSQSPVSTPQSLIMIALSVLLLLSIAIRDLPDYFVEWPQRGMVRYLYRADIKDVARFLNAHPEYTDVGVSSLLAGPWDKVALELDLKEDTAVSVRWYNPERAIVLNPPLLFAAYPNVPTRYEDALSPVAGDNQAGYYSLVQVDLPHEMDEPICFVNGLCIISTQFDPSTKRLELGFAVERELDLPQMPLISNPPPPGVYAGPRLLVFAQLWDANEQFVVGDDGLWVDPYTLQVGDVFLQEHWFSVAEGVVADTAVFGLYDPMTGERILTEDGRDFVRLERGD